MCDNALRSRNEPSHRVIEALFLRDVKTILRLRLISACYENVHYCRGPFKQKKKKSQQTIQQEKCHIPVYTLIHCTFE